MSSFHMYVWMLFQTNVRHTDPCKTVVQFSKWCILYIVCQYDVCEFLRSSGKAKTGRRKYNSMACFIFFNWSSWEYLDFRLDFMVIGVPRKGYGKAREDGLELGLWTSAVVRLAKINWRSLAKKHIRSLNSRLNTDIGFLPLGWGGLWCISFAWPYLLNLGQDIVDKSGPGHHFLIGGALGDTRQWLWLRN